MTQPTIMSKTSIFILSAFLGLLGLALRPGALLGQGDLDPNAVPGPTMKSLAQIYDRTDPRSPISTLPFTISASGSYYLTGNLTAAAGGAGIIVSASNVTIDLGGFSLTGGAGLVQQQGIRVTGAESNVTIRHGTVRGWTNDGIRSSTANTGIRVDNVQAIGNAGRGIAVGNDSVVSACIALGNGGEGISGGQNCQVLSCKVGDSTSAAVAGIFFGDGATVRDCVASDCVRDGIRTGRALIAHCTATGNGDNGISTLDAGTVEACVTSANGDSGIAVAAGSSVTGCVVEANLGPAAISGGIGVSIVRCTLRDNTSSAATSQAILTGSNSQVLDCTVSNSLTTAAALTASTGMGISVAGNCTVERCNVSNSRGDGIRAGSSCRIVGNLLVGSGISTGDGASIHTTGSGNHIDGNSISGGDRGIDVDSFDSIIVRNRVRGATANYDIAAINSVGAIIVPGNNAAINGNGAVASTLGTTDPWANFSE